MCGFFSGTALGSELFEGMRYLRVHLIFLAEGYMQNNPIEVGVGLFLKQVH